MNSGFRYLFLDYVTDFERLTIHTPVDADMLARHLNNYHDKEFICCGFKDGFSLGIRAEQKLQPCAKPYPAKTELRCKIADEVSKGRIVGPFRQPPLEDLMISPVCIIPKPNSEKVRMIFNLSQPKDMSVNDNIDATRIPVKYCSVTDVVQWIKNNQCGDGWFMSKIDLADAYRMVPIKKSDWKFLGMRVGDDIFIDRCLPMGASSSCQTFQKISDALAWLVMKTCAVTCTIFNYLDDFLILAKDNCCCEIALRHFIKLCQDIGIPLSHKKTVYPTQKLVFLGICINSRDHLLSLPLDKAEKALAQLRSFLGKSSPRVGEWQEMLGKLCHLTQVVFAGRPYLSSLYGSLAGILSKHRSRRQRISQEAREDLQVWEHFLAVLTPSKTFGMFDKSSRVGPLYTDAAAKMGYGAVFGIKWFAGVWPHGQWSKLNICVLELYPIYAAIFLWSELLSHETVDVHTDNKALVSILNRLYTKDKSVRWLLKPLAMLCLEHNIHIVAHHIPGEKNKGPDLLSRGKIACFLQQFPEMQRDPTDIPDIVRPENLARPPCN